MSTGKPCRAELIQFWQHPKCTRNRKFWRKNCVSLEKDFIFRFHISYIFFRLLWYIYIYIYIYVYIYVYIIQNNYSIYLTGRVSIFYEIFVQSCDFSYVEIIDEKWIRGLYIYIYIIYGWAGIYILVTSRTDDPAQLSYIEIVLNYWFLNSYSLKLLCIALAHIDCIFFNMYVILLVIILILILLFILLSWFLCSFTKVQVLKYYWGVLL